MANVAIIGTGLVGTSIGLALKRARIKGLEIAGYDREPGTASKAKRAGALDRATWSMVEAVEGASLVVVATPVMAMREVFEIIGPHVPAGAVVTDTGGTKQMVLEWAAQYLPQGVSFVGGYPLVYKDGSGPGAADAALFQGRTYCVLPSAQATEGATDSVLGMVEVLGARPYFISPAEHDSFVAAVDQLPLVLAMALVNSAARSPSWNDIAMLAGQPFREATRLMEMEPELAADLCASNAQSLVHWVDAHIRELYEVRKQLLAADREALQAGFTSAWEQRARWAAGKVRPPETVAMPPATSMATRFSELVVGRRLTEHYQRMTERFDQRDRRSDRGR